MAEQTTETMPAATSAQARYEHLNAPREAFLARARECAELTIPGLLPPSGHSGSSKLYTPFQSIGARGVNNLAAKLLLVLFPPGSPFFRLDVDPLILKKALQSGAINQEQIKELEAALGEVEQAITKRLSQKGTRTKLFETLKHLIVTGNGLLLIQKDGSLKLFPLDRFVVVRDVDGNVLEIVVKETLARASVPKEILAILASNPTAGDNGDPSKSVELYTRVVREDARWAVQQEVMNKVIPGSQGTYPMKRSPWLALRWTDIPGEAYGRGHVEEYLGDLKSCEGLSQAVLEFAAAASKVLFLRNPNGMTDADEVTAAPSGAMIDGDADDIKVLQMEKFGDFQVPKAVLDDCKRDLKEAFLLASSVQRDAERVTAEEIRTLVAELEQSLGGAYSVQAEDLQRPLVIQLLHIAQQAGQVPTLPDDTVEPQIITGVDGLGRTSDLVRLNAWLAGIAQHYGPEVTAQATDPTEYARRSALALGVDQKNLIRTAEEMAAMQQAAANQQMTEKILPPAIQAGAKQAQGGQK